jgi:hypothetical protein
VGYGGDMIIEIKNLPENRNIKSINFDITFEDGEIKKVNETKNYAKTPSIVSGVPVESEIKEKKTVKVSEIPEHKNPVEIPDISDRKPNVGIDMEESF